MVVGTSSRIAGSGFASSPTALGIRAEPSVIAVKFTPMKRSIMSCATCGVSKPTICDALKICAAPSSERLVEGYAQEDGQTLT